MEEGEEGEMTQSREWSRIEGSIIAKTWKPEMGKQGHMQRTVLRKG